MTADAEGGAPEVTLETSMGPFTVEVLLSLSLSLSLSLYPFYFLIISYHFLILFFLVMDSYTTSTHQELAGTFLNYLVEVIMTTLNFTALLRYYKYKN
jgi:hypothetical protein